MAERIVALGAPREHVAVVTLGAERYDIERAADSVNRRPPYTTSARLSMPSPPFGRMRGS
jgi:hypothetical protein